MRIHHLYGLLRHLEMSAILWWLNNKAIHSQLLFKIYLTLDFFWNINHCLKYITPQRVMISLMLFLAVYLFVICLWEKLKIFQTCFQLNLIHNLQNVVFNFFFCVKLRKWIKIMGLLTSQVNQFLTIGNI